MNEDMSQTVSMRAAEYALGTLNASERRVFARQMETDADLRQAAAAWSERLSPLAAACPAVAPSSGLWEKISERIDANAPQNISQNISQVSSAGASATSAAIAPAKVLEMRRARPRWQAASWASGAIAASLALVFSLQILNQSGVRPLSDGMAPRDSVIAAAPPLTAPPLADGSSGKASDTATGAPPHDNALRPGVQIAAAPVDRGLGESPAVSAISGQAASQKPSTITQPSSVGAVSVASAESGSVQSSLQVASGGREQGGLAVGGQIFPVTPMQHSPPQKVAVLDGADKTPQTIVRFETATRMVRIESLNFTAPSGKLLQLWIIPQKGAAHALGAWDVERKPMSVAIPGDLVLEGAEFAVSAEPYGVSNRQEGASPLQGAASANGPTGPILYQRPLTQR